MVLIKYRPLGGGAYTATMLEQSFSVKLSQVAAFARYLLNVGDA